MLKQLQTTAKHSQASERIHFCGYIGGRDKVNLLRKAYCLVIPSRNEAMSVVVLEAGTCGTPVLFTDRCGLEDFAAADAGVMVKVDVEAIRFGLSYTLVETEKLRKYGECLSELVHADYLWSSQAERYRQLYMKLLRQ